MRQSISDRWRARVVDKCSLHGAGRGGGRTSTLQDLISWSTGLRRIQRNWLRPRGEQGEPRRNRRHRWGFSSGSHCRWTTLPSLVLQYRPGWPILPCGYLLLSCARGGSTRLIAFAAVPYLGDSEAFYIQPKSKERAGRAGPA